MLFFNMLVYVQFIYLIIGVVSVVSYFDIGTVVDCLAFVSLINFASTLIDLDPHLKCLRHDLEKIVVVAELMTAVAIVETVEVVETVDKWVPHMVQSQ